MSDESLPLVSSHIKSSAEHAQLLLNKYGHDPLEALILLAQDDGLPAATRVNINKTLMPFRYPQLKAVEIEAVMETKIIVNISKFSDATSHPKTITDKHKVTYNDVIDVESDKQEPPLAIPETSTLEPEESSEPLVSRKFGKMFIDIEEDLL